MNEEQKELTERILAIYRKYDKVFDFFEYYIDDQEVYEDFERLFKTPEAILKAYDERYWELHDMFVCHDLTKEDMQEPLNLRRALKEYVKNHPSELSKNGSNKDLEDRSETR
jgi:hypothetical protein